jgi:small subunit ribosomal protein S24e
MSLNKGFSTLTFEMVTLEDRNNRLLNRREIKLILKDASGRLSRMNAADLIAKEFNADRKAVVPIKMGSEKGSTDIHSTFYIYESVGQMNDQLPRYRVLRNMEKTERKKLLDEEKGRRLKAKQSAVAEAKTSGSRGRR